MARYVLIDYMHLTHRCIKAEPLSTTANINGEVRTIDTTIPTYTIKNVYRYSGQGRFHTGVFLEGGKSHRKEYFAKRAKERGNYKEGRPKRSGAFFEGVNLAVNLMYNGKVSLYRVETMEADDLIYSAVHKIKEIDKTTPIDIITNDSDLLPLVDDQVSVYMRGNRTHAEPGCPELRLYYQVTPNTWEDYLSYTSAYRAYYIPFNSMLLFKLIRGDKADNVQGAIRGYGGKKYSDLMEQMEEDEVDFENTFRYGVDFDEVMAPILLDYFDEEVVEEMKFIYNGIGLKYNNLVIPKQIEAGYLQAALTPVKINLVR